MLKRPRASAVQPMPGLSAIGLGGNRLTPTIIAAWQRRIGAEQDRMATPTIGVYPRGSSEPNTGIQMGPAADGTYRNVLYSQRVGFGGAFCMLSSPYRMERTPEAVRDDPSELLLVNASAFPGETRLFQNGHEHRYASGDLIAVSTRTPFVQTVERIRDTAGLVIPLSRLGSRAYLADRPRRRSGMDTPIARATGSFVRRLAIELSVTGSEFDPRGEEAVIDLVAAALTELAIGGDPGLDDDRLFVRESAIDLINRRYRDPSLSPDTVAAELHVSRRHLYRLFEDEGVSLARLIADTRVSAARLLLDECPWMEIGAVAAACGYRSAATFRNQFRARHGMSPSEYRQRMAAADREATGDASTRASPASPPDDSTAP